MEPVGREPGRLSTLIIQTDNALDVLHDRIDLLFERTAGLRIPRPADPSLSSPTQDGYGAWVLDAEAAQADRVMRAVERLSLLLDELEV